MTSFRRRGSAARFQVLGSRRCIPRLRPRRGWCKRLGRFCSGTRPRPVLTLRPRRRHVPALAVPPDRNRATGAAHGSVDDQRLASRWCFAGGHDDRGAPAILLESIGGKHLGDEPAVGEPGDASGSLFPLRGFWAAMIGDNGSCPCDAVRGDGCSAASPWIIPASTAEPRAAPRRRTLPWGARPAPGRWPNGAAHRDMPPTCGCRGARPWRLPYRNPGGAIGRC
jgi:hypothetical protein